jgi:CRP/FNR family transcriptional activator FtrB
MRASDFPRVRELHLFAGMAGENFEALVEAAFLQRFPAHVQLIREGEPADFLHVVIEGMVALTASSASKEATLGIVRPVSTFILAAVITDKPYLKAARTLEPSLILMLPAEKVREIFAQDVTFARAVVDELSMRYRDVVRELRNQTLRNSLERLAAWIVRREAIDGGEGLVTIPYDKRTLASRLGMTPENLSRNFQLLTEHGAHVDGRDITITDRARLVALARPDPLTDSR